MSSEPASLLSEGGGGGLIALVTLIITIGGLLATKFTKSGQQTKMVDDNSKDVATIMLAQAEMQNTLQTHITIHQHTERRLAKLEEDAEDHGKALARIEGREDARNETRERTTDSGRRRRGEGT